MSAICREPGCGWHGPLDDLYPHYEKLHPSRIKELTNNSYFQFDIADINKPAFLLCGENGLYWFDVRTFNPGESEETFNRGVFHIGDSEPITYILKLGSKREGYAQYFKPQTSQSDIDISNIDAGEVYNLNFPSSYLDFLNEYTSTTNMQLYFGECNDKSDCYYPMVEELTWTKEDEETNEKCIEQFTCFICFEYIRNNARFCERKHFLCNDCFLKLMETPSARCPMCKGDYLYDSFDERIELLLRMIKFPNEPKSQKVPK